MTDPVLFEAVKTADGAYQCLPISASRFISDDPAPAEPVQQAFFIDSNLMQAVLPDWAAEAQAVFLQSLHSNALGGHTAYFLQVQARFEQMRQSLQQQLDEFSRFG
ncbi:hypothetical protein [Rheinheimera texasensis]|uniref:hypothetical protein n=1 Tax=Rheinheimera texasensis TaxID=306205 RepID=UPI0032B30312